MTLHNPCRKFLATPLVTITFSLLSYLFFIEIIDCRSVVSAQVFYLRKLLNPESHELSLKMQIFPMLHFLKFIFIIIS